MFATTGCCWPRGTSTGSCSARCWGGSGRCLCQAGNGRRAATDKRRWVAEEGTTRSSVGVKPSSELERGDRAAFSDRNRSERSIDRERRTKTLHPSRGLEYPDRAGMAKTEIPVKSLAPKGTFLLGQRRGHFYWAATRHQGLLDPSAGPVLSSACGFGRSAQGYQRPPGDRLHCFRAKGRNF